MLYVNWLCKMITINLLTHYGYFILFFVVTIAIFILFLQLYVYLDRVLESRFVFLNLNILYFINSS